jgi:anhydro-N-acetylmuramic acid kinase
MIKKAMVVAGVMSGTSADGINVALVRVGAGGRSSLRLLGHSEYFYPKKVRAAILAAMNASEAIVADLARLNFLLGQLYAEAVLAAERQFKLKAELIGCHGQTLYHQGEASRFLDRNIVATWQTGEAAIIAATVGVPVVSDFRPADMAAGGKGAPLVPFLDYLLFRDARRGRIMQNIGGIANLTAIPAGASQEDIIAFDSGPGNMVIDAITEKLFGQPFDRGGRIAASGNVLDNVVENFLRLDFFKRKPPKTAGREEFGREFVQAFLRSCGRAPKQNVVATATALTATSIADAVRRLSKNSQSGRSPRSAQTYKEMILSGGGAKNSALMTMLSAELAPLGVRLRFSDDFGLPSAAKEAVAFAVLAYQTWHRRASSVPSATGAKGAKVLGKISYP